MTHRADDSAGGVGGLPVDFLRSRDPSGPLGTMRVVVPAVLLTLLAIAAPPAATATPGGGASVGRGGRRAARSRSVGLPFRGRLQNGVRLRESEHVRYVPEYAEGGHHYGTWQLVQLIERAAARVYGRLRGGPLSVGELSAARGGRLPGHRSHQNGRDVDLAFYMLGPRGPFQPYAFAAFDGDGVGRGPNAMLRFDDDRNWELVAKLVADGDARVQHIFVSRAIRRRLLATGRRRRARRVLLDRASRVLGQPSHGHRHANHFHVRIYCGPAERPAAKTVARSTLGIPGRGRAE